MIGVLRFVLSVVVSPFRSKARLEAEIAVLRQQLIVLRRRVAEEFGLQTVTGGSSSSSIVCVLRFYRRSASSVPRRWYGGIEPDFAAIGIGSLGGEEGAHRLTQSYEG
jgi:hypothetical protein